MPVFTLDMKTLSFICGLISALMSLTLIIVLKTTKTYKGFAYWTAGFVANAIGMILLSLRNIAPDFISIIVANFSVTIFLILCDRGISIYCKQSSNNYLHITIIVAQIFSFLYYTYNSPNVTARIIIISGFFTIVSGHSLFILFKYYKTILNKQPILLYSGYLIGFSWFLVRTIFTAYTNPVINDFMKSGNFQAMAFIVIIIMPIINTIGFIIINHQRLEVAYNKTIEKLSKSEECLQNSEKQLIEALRIKSEFLSNVSHEIRTPLNAVIGLSEFLEEMIQDLKQRSYLTSIKMAGQTLLRLINDVLDLSKIEAGHMKINPVFFRISILLDEMKQIFRLKAEEKKLELFFECNDESTLIKLDDIRIRQILINLIGNALKFTESGFIKIKSNLTKNEKRAELIISVEDTGTGIPQKDSDMIFDAFQQQEGHDTRRYGGTGLGLAISNRLVRMQGGTINLKSEIGKGSTFTVNFPDVEWQEPIMQTEEYHIKRENYSTVSLNISSAMKEYISEIFMPKLKQLEGAFKITEIKELGKKLLQKSIETNDLNVKELAQQIINAANTFDIVALKDMVKIAEKYIE